MIQYPPWRSLSPYSYPYTISHLHLLSLGQLKYSNGNTVTYVEVEEGGEKVGREEMEDCNKIGRGGGEGRMEGWGTLKLK